MKHLFRRSLCFLLVTLLLLGSLPLAAIAENASIFEEEEEGEVVWRVEGDTLYLGGVKRIPDSFMYDFDYYGIPSCPYLVIEEGVEVIGYHAFGYGDTGIVSVTLPSTLTVIEESAFAECMLLSSVNLPDSLQIIEKNAFSNTAITEITVPEKITVIEESTFAYCSSLASVTLPDGLLEIGASAFSNTAITSLDIPDTVTAIGSHAFFYCEALESITLPRDLRLIGENAFEGAALTSVALPDGLTELGNYAFHGAYRLASITFPASLTSIGAHAFEETDLTAAELPEALRSIGDYAFYQTNLKTLSVPGVESIGRGAFSECTELREVTLPAALNVLSAEAFYGDYLLTTLYLKGSTQQFEDGALSGLSRLTEIVNHAEEPIPEEELTRLGAPATVTVHTDADSRIVESGDYLWFPAENEAVLLSYLGTNGELTLPEAVTLGSTQYDSYRIAPYAFYRAASDLGASFTLTSVVIPDTVTAIGAGAFSYCLYLESITLPAGLRTIEENTFEYAMRLPSITLPDSIERIEEYAFYYNYSLASVRFPRALTYIGEYAFAAKNAITALTLPEGLQSIDNYAFYLNTNLTAVQLPSTLTHIGEGAFSYARALEEIKLPEHVSHIGKGAFFSTAITTVTLPSSLKELGESAFGGCTALTSVTLPSSLKELGESAFGGCTALTSVTLPEGLQSIGVQAFVGTQLSEIVLPDSLISIGDYAFYQVPLTAVRFPASLQTLGMGAFSYTLLTSAKLPASLKEIGSGAFVSTPLVSVEISEGTETIGNQAFAACDSLETVILPQRSLKHIEGFAFAMCPSLREITLPDSLEELGYGAFYQSGLESIELPANLTWLESYVFSQCQHLVSVKLPALLEEIYLAFEGCIRLRSLYVPPSVTFIDEDTFDGCESLTLLVDEGSYAEEYAKEYEIPYAYSTAVKSISLSLVSPSGETLRNGYTVRWYDDETDTCIGIGTTLYGALEGQTLRYEVILYEALAVDFLPPSENCTLTVSEDATLTVTLTKRPTVQLGGKAVDENGNAVGGATVTAVQQLSPDVTVTASTVTDENGSFTLTVKQADTRLSVRADGYYNKQLSLSAEQLKDSELILSPIALKALGSTKLSLLLTATSTDAAGNPQSRPISTLDGFSVSVYNQTRDCEITDVTTRQAAVYFEDGTCSPYDVLSVTLTDTSGKCAPISLNVTLDVLGEGYAEVTLLERGRLLIREIAGEAAPLIAIFDTNGDCVTSAQAGGNYLSAPLPAGEYTLLAMTHTSILQSLSSLSVLEGMGLSDEDVLLMPVTVEDGRTALIERIEVPALDVEKLIVTDSSSTSLTSNASSSIVGRHFLVRCEYAVKEDVNTADQALLIELPDGIEVPENGVLFNNDRVPYTLENGLLRVQTNAPSGILRFYAVSTKTGTHTLRSTLEATRNGIPMTQPMGSLSFTAESGSLEAPTKISSYPFAVSGTATPNSNITVYLDDTVIGSTISNNVGDWAIQASPNNLTLSSMTYRTVRATAENEVLDEIVALPEQTVFYDTSLPTVSKLTMINPDNFEEKIVVIDFHSPTTQIPYYMYNPSCNSFTFIVEFASGVEEVTDVTVVSVGSRGVTCYTPCVWDSTREAFVGTRTFSVDDAPASLHVSYATVGEDSRSVVSEERVKEVTQNTQKVIDEAVEELSSNMEISKIVETDSGFTYSAVYTPTGEAFASTAIEVIDFASIDLSDERFREMTAEDGERYLLLEEPSEAGFILTYVVPSLETAIRVRAEYATKEESSPIANDGVLGKSGWFHIRDFGKILGKNLNAIGMIKDLIDSINDAGQHIILTKELEELWAMYQELYRETSNFYPVIKCPDGTYKLSPEDRMIAFQMFLEAYDLADETYQALLDELDLFRYKVIADAVLQLLGPLLSAVNFNGAVERALNGMLEKVIPNALNRAKLELIIIPGLMGYTTYSAINEDVRDGKEALVSLMDFSASMGSLVLDETHGAMSLLENLVGLPKNPINGYALTSAGLDQMIQEFYHSSRQHIMDVITWVRAHAKSCEEEPEPIPEPVPPGPDKTPDRELTPNIDPSGYVCEAVPSNRLEGVRVEAYYYDYALDDFGIPKDQKSDIFWDASKYSQANPLYTDANGRYAWDVPPGQWLVKFSKDGYLPADSRNDPAADAEGYLPVPPPQTEVNIALVSTQAPEIAEVYAYTDTVRIRFSQYMSLDSVNTANVRIKVNGEEVAGSIAPLNAEASFDDPNVSYASIFAFTPANEISGTAIVTVENAVNYAGSVMSERYTAEHPIRLLPRELEVAESISVDNNGGALLSIKLLPAEAAEGKTLEIISKTPSIASVQESTLVLGADGSATVMVEGHLPGSGTILVRVPGTDIEANVTVKVLTKVEDPDACKKVTASITSGSVVEKGTQIVLSCETEGAEIYYTLDKSCPCDTSNPARIKYTGPITVNEDTFLIAYAVKEGMNDSATAGFAYTVATEELPPEDTTPEDTTPEDTTPEESEPEDTAPEDTAPEDTAPEDTTPEDTEAEPAEPTETEPDVPDEPDEPDEPEETKPTSSDKTDTSDPGGASPVLWVLVALGMIAAAAAVGAVLFLGRKKPKKPKSAPPQTPPEDPFADLLPPESTDESNGGDTQDSEE